METRDMRKVLVFAGSTRENSFNKKLAKVAEKALRHAGLEVTYADLRDYPMPLYDGDSEQANGLPPTARAFKALVREHDAIVIASPEYNGSFPALVKNVIDWVSRSEAAGEPPLAALRGKRGAILSTSPGARGGQRGLRHLRELLEMVGVVLIPEPVSIPKAGEAFDAEGKLVRPEDVEKVERMAAGLAALLAPLAATPAVT